VYLGQYIMQSKITFLTCLILFIHTCASAATLFTPRLTLTEEYNDNLDLAPDNDPDNEKRADWRTTISPGVSLEVANRTSGILIDYEPSMVMYNRYSDDDTWRHRGLIDYWIDFSRYSSFEFENETTYTEEPISEVDSTIRTGRNHYVLNVTSADFFHQFGREDSFDLGYSYRILENEDNSIENTLEDTRRHESYLRLTYWPVVNEWGTETELRYQKGIYQESDFIFDKADHISDPSDDFDFWSAGSQLIRRFTPHFEGTFRYTYSKIDYDGETEDYQLHEAGPGFRYFIGENTDLSFEGMYIFRDRATSRDQSTFLLVSEIVQRWILSRSSVELTGSTGFDPETFGAENNGFDLFASIDANYEYSFSRETHWDLFGGFRWDRYIDLEPERLDNTIQAGTGLSHQVFSWAELRLDYRYRQVLSEDYYHEYAQNRVMLSLTLMPSREHGSLRDQQSFGGLSHDDTDHHLRQRDRDQEASEDGDENSSNHR
jgi:hypothetical protein